LLLLPVSSRPASVTPDTSPATQLQPQNPYRCVSCSWSRRIWYG